MIVTVVVLGCTVADDAMMTLLARPYLPGLEINLPDIVMAVKTSFHLQLVKDPFLLSTNSSRGVKRQVAQSTVNGLDKFLAPEPWQFCSDFLFGANNIGIRCYFELNITENVPNRAMVCFDFGA